MNLIDLLPATIDTWQRQDDTAKYNRETIFKYIDGAGEVYNSYAFREVAVARYFQSGSQQITVELFDMGNMYDAFGVFSYAREREETGIGGGYDLRGSVLCYWQNRYYICVALEESTDQSDNLLKLVARAVSANLPAQSERPPLVGKLPSVGLIPFSDRYIHLSSSLNYHYYLGRENILKLDSTTNAVLARYQPGSTILILIEYPDKAVASSSVESFQQGFLRGKGVGRAVEIKQGKYASIEQMNRYLMIVLDAATSQGADSLLAAGRASLSNLK